MKLMIPFTAASALVLAACSGETVEDGETDLVDDEAMAAEAEPVSWSYEGEGGPENWAGLSADNAVCDTGTRQSPIDIPASSEVSGEGGPELAINWQEGPLVVDGQGYNANVEGTEGSYITIDGTRYDFVQMHMHAPSEERVNGRQYAADAHFVHADASGDLAVVGVLFEEGETNPALDPIWGALSTDKLRTEVDGETFDPNSLLPEERDFYAYEGSLTTPPCSEGVQWIVMSEPVTISAEQVEVYTSLFGETARPVQPANDREIVFTDS